MDLIEQRAAVKFCYKSGDNAAETYRKLRKAYGGGCLSKSTVYDWFKRFQSGRESLEDDPRSGRPSTSKNDENADRIREYLSKGRRVTCRVIADDLGLSKTIVHEILTDVLKKKKVCSRFVPHFLTPEQKEHRVTSSQDLVDMADCDSDFLNCVVAGDESWCYEYDPSTKRQTSEWVGKNSPRSSKVRSVKSKTKTMLIVFFDARGIIHREFVPPNQTVNAVFYKGVMERLLARIRRVRPQFHESGDWFLLHDNAPSHSSILVKQYLAKRQVVCIDHPPYSPDLAPPDYFLFPKVKMPMKGHRFSSIEEIQTRVTEVLRTIPEEAFSRAFQCLYERSKKCIEKHGDYIEA